MQTNYFEKRMEERRHRMAVRIGRAYHCYRFRRGLAVVMLGQTRYRAAPPAIAAMMLEFEEKTRDAREAARLLPAQRRAVRLHIWPWWLNVRDTARQRHEREARQRLWQAAARKTQAERAQMRAMALRDSAAVDLQAAVRAALARRLRVRLARAARDATIARREVLAARVIQRAARAYLAKHPAPAPDEWKPLHNRRPRHRRLDATRNWMRDMRTRHDEARRYRARVRAARAAAKRAGVPFELTEDLMFDPEEMAAARYSVIHTQNITMQQSGVIDVWLTVGAQQMVDFEERQKLRRNQGMYVFERVGVDLRDNLPRDRNNG
eukprot:g6596.t1